MGSIPASSARGERQGVPTWRFHASDCGEGALGLLERLLALVLKRGVNLGADPGTELCHVSRVSASEPSCGNARKGTRPESTFGNARAALGLEASQPSTRAGGKLCEALGDMAASEAVDDRGDARHLGEKAVVDDLGDGRQSCTLTRGMCTAGVGTAIPSSELDELAHASRGTSSSTSLFSMAPACLRVAWPADQKLSSNSPVTSPVAMARLLAGAAAASAASAVCCIACRRARCVGVIDMISLSSRTQTSPSHHCRCPSLLTFAKKGTSFRLVT